ncbi:hypothetical protein P5673_015706 [Acropora cervicornis]|uniref:Uncharacterized protein n=1 Tax=Acropora cervicornis TaxID=6130 RepID=A0AAD9QHX6_ACRCE|nr:hypothetical protein P5673_015706 [Acropora cervicornis]
MDNLIFDVNRTSTGKLGAGEVQFRHQTAGNCFEEIRKILNNIKEPQFCVSQKSLRDRLKILERDCKSRKREADQGSGISPEYREIDHGRIS